MSEPQKLKLDIVIGIPQYENIELDMEEMQAALEVYRKKNHYGEIPVSQRV